MYFYSSPKFWDESRFPNLVSCLNMFQILGCWHNQLQLIAQPRYAYNFATRGHRTMAIAPMYDNYEGAFYQCQGALGLPDLVQTVTDWFGFTMFYPKFKGAVTDTGISTGTKERPGATVESSPSRHQEFWTFRWSSWGAHGLFLYDGWTWWGVVGRFWSLALD